MNRKILYSILSGTLMLAGYPLAVSASYLGNYGSKINVKDMVNSIETSVWIVFVGVAVVCFVIAGILFLTAGGEPEKLKTARSAFIWGVVGIVVAIVAYSIIAIVGSVL